MIPNTLNTAIIIIINLILLLYSLWLNKKIFNSYAYISLPFVFNMMFVFFYIGVYSYIIFSDHMTMYFCNTNNFEYPFKSVIFVTFCNLSFCIGETLILLKTRKLSFHQIVKKLIKIYSIKDLKKLGIITFLFGVISKLIYFVILGKGNLIYYLKNYFSIQVAGVGAGVGADFYLRFLFSFITIGATILLIYTLLTKQSKLLTTLIIISSVIMNFNSRLSIITFLLQLLILVCLYSNSTRKKVPSIFLLIVLPVFFILIAGLGIYRDSTNGKVHTNIDVGYFILGNIHTNRALSDALEANYDLTNQYYGINIIAPIIFKPIPRKIWTNKPLNAAAIYTESVSPGTLKQGFAIAPGIMYELYINFGFIGTIISFVIIGYILMFLQFLFLKEFLLNPLNVFIPLILSCIISRTLYLRGEDLTLMYTYTSFFIIDYILIFLNVRLKNNVWRRDICKKMYQ